MTFSEIKDSAEAALVILRIQHKNKQLELDEIELKVEEQAGMLADANAWLES
tara:strand:+ start:1848 stop:2003 length:156 start_codon:yes stop_codon:yes gene_type:complete